MKSTNGFLHTLLVRDFNFLREAIDCPFGVHNSLRKRADSQRFIFPK